MTEDSYTYMRAKPSQPSQEDNNELNIKEKKAARVGKQPSQTLADPRKAGKAGKTGKAKPRRRAKAPRTAADMRVKERIAAPMADADGKLSVPERFIDTVEMLYRRRQIDARQLQAAETYREAIERVEGGIPSPLDTSRVRGGSGIASPTEAQLWAAAMLSEAERILGKIDGRIVALVVSGMGIAEVALAIFGSEQGRARRGDSEHVGRRLREALAALADTWWPAPPAGRIRAVRDPMDVSASAGFSGVVEPGRVAHASRGRVRFSD